MAATRRIAAAALIDPLYSPGGRPTNAHPPTGPSKQCMTPCIICPFPIRHLDQLFAGLAASHPFKNKSKGSPYSITERRGLWVPELIPVLGSQPAGDVNHKPDGRLQLLSARPAVTPARPQPLRGLLPILLLGEQRHNGRPYV